MDYESLTFGMALFLYLANLVFVVFLVMQFWKRGDYAIVFCIVYLCVFIAIRPPIMFLNLDTPLIAMGATTWVNICLAQFAIFLWLFSFSASAAYLQKSAIIFSVFVPPSFIPGRKIMLIFALVFSAIGIGMTLKFILDSGSIGRFIFNVKTEKAFAGLYVIRWMCVLASLLSVIILIDTVIQSRGKLRFNFYTIIALALILINLAANYAWGNRMNIALVIMIAFFSWHLLVKRFTLKELIFWGFIALIGLQSLRILREFLIGESLARAISPLDVLSFWRGVSLSMHFAQFDGLMLALRDSGDLFNFRLGQDFLNGFASWLPKALFPEGHETYHIGGWFRRVYEPTKVNGWPVTVIGSWYVNFGWLGIVIGAIISAVLAHAVQFKMRGMGRTSWDTVIAVGFLAFVLDGGINTGFGQSILLYTGPILVIALMTKLTASRQSRAES